MNSIGGGKRTIQFIKKHKDLIFKDLVLFQKDPVLFKKRTYVFQSITMLQLLSPPIVG